MTAAAVLTPFVDPLTMVETVFNKYDNQETWVRFKKGNLAESGKWSGLQRSGHTFAVLPEGGPLTSKTVYTIQGLWVTYEHPNANKISEYGKIALSAGLWYDVDKPHPNTTVRYTNREIYLSFTSGTPTFSVTKGVFQPLVIK